MGLEQVETTQEDGQAAKRAAESAPLADPTTPEALHEELLGEGTSLEEPEEELLPRDPTLLLSPEAQPQGDWNRTDEYSRPSGYKPPPGKRGRKPDPRGERAMRTYQDWKVRAGTTTAEDRAAARAFGLEVMEAMRARGEREKADEFGRREGFLLDVKPLEATSAAHPAAAAAPVSGAAPSGASPPQPPQADGAAARPQGPRVHGQPVARLQGSLQAVSPLVDALAGLSAAWGVDLSQPTKKTFFRGTTEQREVEISPKERLAELLAKKMCERAEEAGIVEGDDDEENTNLELLMLLGTTVGPVAMAVGKRVLQTCGRGAVALFGLVRRRR